MGELKMTYRLCEHDGELVLWVRVNDDAELGPVRLEGSDAAELTDMFNRMTTLLQRLQARQQPAKRGPPRRSRPSGIRAVLDDDGG